MGYGDRSGTNLRIGDQPPALKADVWFPAGAAAALAQPGHVELITELPRFSSWWYDHPLPTVYKRFYDFFAELKRWGEWYGPRGLRITVVAQLRPGQNNPLFGYRPLTEDKAADVMNWFIREYAKVPCQLAITTGPPLKPLAAPDGRLTVPDTTIDGIQHYYQSRSSEFNETYGFRRSDTHAMLVIGRDGRIKFIGEDAWRHVDELLARLFRTAPPGPAIGSPPAPPAAGPGGWAAPPTGR